MSEKEYIERDCSKCYHYPVCESNGVCACYIPDAGVVEVVRCKDCKRWLKDAAGCTDFVGRCEWANYMVGANGYCVYGEAKMDGKDEGE